MQSCTAFTQKMNLKSHRLAKHRYWVKARENKPYWADCPTTPKNNPRGENTLEQASLLSTKVSQKVTGLSPFHSQEDISFWTSILSYK